MQITSLRMGWGWWVGWGVVTPNQSLFLLFELRFSAIWWKSFKWNHAKGSLRTPFNQFCHSGEEGGGSSITLQPWLGKKSTSTLLEYWAPLCWLCVFCHLWWDSHQLWRRDDCSSIRLSIDNWNVWKKSPTSCNRHLPWGVKPVHTICTECIYSTNATMRLWYTAPQNHLYIGIFFCQWNSNTPSYTLSWCWYYMLFNWNICKHMMYGVCFLMTDTGDSLHCGWLCWWCQIVSLKQTYTCM